LHLDEVEAVPPAADAPAGGIVHVRRLLGTVEGPEPDTLAAGRELCHLGAVQAPADTAETRRPDWVVAAARRYGSGGTGSGAAKA
jgi:hypothetical protein